MDLGLFPGLDGWQKIAWTEKWRRQERRMDISMAVFWTIYVAAITTYIVLAATGHLHHH